MPVEITSVGMDFFTRVLLGVTPALPFTLHLYQAFHVPTVDSVPGDFVECSLPGYAAVTIGSASWQGKTTEGIAAYRSGPATFTLSPYPLPAVTLFGYFVTTPDGLKLLWAQDFQKPYQVPTAGISFGMYLTWQSQEI